MSWNVADRYKVQVSDTYNTGTIDNTAALFALQKDLAALARTEKMLPKVVFPSGVIAFKIWPNLAFSHLDLAADGQCILKPTGTTGVIFDGNVHSPQQGVNHMRVDGFTIAPTTQCGDALTVTAVHRSYFDVKVTGAGPKHAAIVIKFNVASEWRAKICWWGLPPDVPVLHQCEGIVLDNTEVDNTPVSGCNFYYPIAEGPTIGMHIKNANGCNIIGGVFEACDIGVQIDHGGGYNRFIGTDLEANHDADVVFNSGAHSNLFWQCGPRQHWKVRGQWSTWNNRIKTGLLDGVFGI